jgi:hypothetical protein
VIGNRIEIYPEDKKGRPSGRRMGKSNAYTRGNRMRRRIGWPCMGRG